MSRQHVRTLSPQQATDLEKLYEEITFLSHQVQALTLQPPHIKTLLLYWNIGKLLETEYKECMQNNEDQNFLLNLSTYLEKEIGKEFDTSVLEDSCKFYVFYPSFSEKSRQSERAEVEQTLSSLTWDHYRLLVYVSCSKARTFYEKEAINSCWSPSLLRQFINSRLFEGSPRV